MTTFLLLESLGLLLLILTPFLPKSWWITDLASHFVLQYAIAAAVLLILCLILQIHHRWIYTSLLAAYFICVFHMFPYISFAGNIKTDLQTIKVLQANVLVQNKNTKPFAKLIEKEDPDIIIVNEVNTPFAEMLKSLKETYPHQHIHIQDRGSFGIALLSKSSLENREEKYLAHEQIPSIFATTTIHDKKINLVALHAANPLRDFALRDKEFKELVPLIDKDARTIVAGDFNTTPYAPAFKQLIRNSGLINTRKGRGLNGTHPAWMPVGFLRMPIDHVLTGGVLYTKDFYLGPNIGSDHLPTIAEIAF